jgi:D-alanyl-lipoteichoic acid acyltransferase DltB (MBOAT superfamily)
MWVLIFASLIFYSYWDLRFLPFLLVSVCGNWLLARLFHRHEKKSIITFGIAFNLILIAVFKYLEFLVSSLASLFGQDHTSWGIILPLGISFFTFQQISYLVDLRRKDASLYPFSSYILYVIFFPQLIAGPIVRHNEIIPQFAVDPLRADPYERIVRGLGLFMVGLAKKVWLADPLGAVASPVFETAEAGDALGGTAAWFGALAYMFQIYFDFSGYSDMAIGLALMFGFTIPVNFNAPYVAVGIRDFWRRWHMTLSRFLRDYLYIPQGGSRFGRRRQIRALMVTMLLGGLWHGAGWTFVAWGGLHGAALVCSHLWERTRVQIPDLVGWMLTFLFLLLTWVIFRAESFSSAINIFTAMLSGFGGYESRQSTSVLLLLSSAFAISMFGTTSQSWALERMRPSGALAIGLAATLFVLILVINDGGYTEFIYFQF